MKLAEFKEEVAIVWCMAGSRTPTRGRPLADTAPKKSRGRPVTLPPSDYRTNHGGHLPKKHKVAQKCRFVGCKLKTVFECRTCSVYLCIKDEHDHFYEFHQ